MSELLPGGAEVAFADLPATAEAAIATVVVVAPRERIRDAADALGGAAEFNGLRVVLIAADADAPPAVRTAASGILLEGLKASYFDNAVAALRLSSLPTLVWWRGGSPDVLASLASLADRLVLDAPDPSAVWPLVPQLAEHTAVTDIRWARLTRWRSLMAHFFDIPDVRDRSASFHTLEIHGADGHAARLFAGWLLSSLQLKTAVDVRVTDVPGGSPIESVRLSNAERRLTLRLAESRTCVMTAVEGDGADVSRIVSLGDQSLAALITEELRVRSRDRAFERAVSAVGGIR
jgi:glucose-6-phosphate dehydrogenase assembly protein OpcA